MNLLFVLLLLCQFFASPSFSKELRLETLMKREDVVWGFDFLKDGRILFTERGGALGLYDPKKKTTEIISGTPKVFHEGQGGLLDVRVHPKTQAVYLTYSEPVGDNAVTALGMGELKDNSLKNFKKIFSARAPHSSGMHFGSRVDFDGMGHLFVTVGERNQRERAQDLSYHHGKILRLNEDGSVPKDNPFVGKTGAQPEIWSYGHRNSQGIAFDSNSKELWMAEMGPRGGDELNLVKPAVNYGWPIATFGKEYSGFSIGPSSHEGTVQPVGHWVPSISPSGLAIYRGKQFPHWNGNLFLACLSGTSLVRLELKNQQVVRQEKLLEKLGLRFRHVRMGPDGFLYVSTDDGLLARVE